MTAAPTPGPHAWWQQWGAWLPPTPRAPIGEAAPTAAAEADLEPGETEDSYEDSENARVEVNEQLAALFAQSEQRRSARNERGRQRPRRDDERADGAVLPKDPAMFPNPAVRVSPDRMYGEHGRAVRELEASLNASVIRIADEERPRRWPLAVA